MVRGRERERERWSQGGWQGGCPGCGASTHPSAGKGQRPGPGLPVGPAGASPNPALPGPPHAQNQGALAGVGWGEWGRGKAKLGSQTSGQAGGGGPDIQPVCPREPHGAPYPHCQLWPGRCPWAVPAVTRGTRSPEDRVWHTAPHHTHTHTAGRHSPAGNQGSEGPRPSFLQLSQGAPGGAGGVTSASAAQRLVLSSLTNHSPTDLPTWAWTPARPAVPPRGSPQEAVAWSPPGCPPCRICLWRWAGWSLTEEIGTDRNAK